MREHTTQQRTAEERLPESIDQKIGIVNAEDAQLKLIQACWGARSNRLGLCQTHHEPIDRSNRCILVEDDDTRMPTSCPSLSSFFTMLDSPMRSC